MLLPGTPLWHAHCGTPCLVGYCSGVYSAAVYGHWTIVEYWLEGQVLASVSMHRHLSQMQSS